MSSQECTVGERVLLKIAVQANTPEGEYLNAWKGKFVFDAEAFDYVGFAITDDSVKKDSVAGANSVWEVNLETPGTIVIGFANALGCSEDGYLFTLILQAKPT